MNISDGSTAPARVVGVAVVRHGRVLAARRLGPPEVAGGWEFPGGKVQPGESVEGAGTREIREELGLEVVVRTTLSGAQDAGNGHVLTVVVAGEVGGALVLREHDAVRWLSPEELDEVAWLTPDRPFLGELRELLLAGSELEGGNVGGAVRIGPTVRRPMGSWSPAVHELLAHLHRAGLRGVPRVLGVDEWGREILTHFEGRVDGHGDAVLSDEVLAEGIAWVRDFHQAVRAFRPPGVVRWRTGARELAPEEIVCHHDVGGYNWVVDDDGLVGVIDWDMAGPGHPIEDLSFVAWNTVPLAIVTPEVDVVRRLRLMAAVYGGGVQPAQILDGVDARINGAAQKIQAGQDAGDGGMLNLLRVGEPARTRKRLAVLRDRLPALRRLL